LKLNAGTRSDFITIKGAASGTLIQVDAGAGDDVIRLRVAGLSGNILGGEGNDTVLGPDAPNTWTIKSLDHGAVGGVSCAAEFLKGGSDSDTFIISRGKGISGSIDGAGGVDRLDYSAWTSPVTVSLKARSATGLAHGVVRVEDVIGG